ncbi:MAG TPA: hypothetical protein EYG88_05950 [Desulfocapsa sulfexigens]|nr:hypothetical protein [Desulfocapsa sulfexigens]
MILRLSFFLATLFFLPQQALAHKIHVFAWVSGDTVTVESSFSGNRPLIGGKVTVKDNTSGTVLLTGVGDKKGIFTFPLPAKVKKKATDLLIVVAGNEGHQSEWLIPATEYLSATHVPTPEVPDGMDNAELKKMLEELIRQELAPIKRSLAESRQNKPGFRDIMGGIGYLIGLAGLAAWLRNRAKPKKTDD